MIFKNINLNIKKSELIGIIAPSGTGKTSLLNICGLLDLPSCGEVRILNKNTKSLTIEMRNNIRKKYLGFVFQSSNLINEFNAIENVALSRIIKGYNFPDALDYAKKLLINVGLKNRLYSRPLQLSGGEKQRVSIARAVINNPQIILADEPTGSLDLDTAKEIFNLLKNQINSNRLIIFATHNRFFANKSDCLLEMVNGNIKAING